MAPQPDLFKMFASYSYRLIRAEILALNGWPPDCGHPISAVSDCVVGGRRYFWTGNVSSRWTVSTTKTASNFAGFVLLAFSLTLWRSPGISEKLSPAL